MYNEYSEFVQSELLELESRDIDQLFECIKENIEAMYSGTSIVHTIDDALLRDTIEYFLGESLVEFLKTERAYMHADLSAIVKDLQGQIKCNPEEYTEFGAEEPSIDVRLCIDAGPNGYTWIFRPGIADFDPYHSLYCAASSIGTDTNASDLLSELINQI